MTRSAVTVLDAGSAIDSAAGWVVFRGDGPVPSAPRLAKAGSAAQNAGLAILTPAPHSQRPVDLDIAPDALRLDGAVVLFRVAVLREHGLRPDPDLDPDLAVTLLAARYLLSIPHPTLVGVRSRCLPPVTVDWRAASRYSLAPRRFATLLEQVHSERGSVPRWLQHLWVGQAFSYLREDRRLFTPVASLDEATIAAFHGALGSALGHIDERVVADYAGADVTHEARAALLIGTRTHPTHTRPTRQDDPGRGLARVSYLFRGEPPTEAVTIAGAPLRPEHAKIRTVEIVGRPLLAERILWVPQTARAVVEDAGEIAVRGAPPTGRAVRYRRVIADTPGIARLLARDLRIRLRARGPSARQRYRSAWLLMDRDTAAQDNAEHLCRYLVGTEPDVNAWFVLSRDSPDWDRLRREGFRLLDYGSDEYFVALLNCAHLISSQVDDYVCKPLRRHALGRPRWRFTFLQHGVLWHDLSRWLNRKQIDCFVTSTPAEHDAIVADHTPYVFTDLETRMVGLARHDRLLRLSENTETQWLLVMPTWRPQLLGPQEGGNARGLVDDFWNSAYARTWRGLLESDALRSLCERQGWQLAFVPHPNMQGYLTGAQLPQHVASYRFSEIDVQTLIAGAAALVTDYSSLANDAAYVHRPVVYYQFDRTEFFAGSDFRRPGTWSYERDGFGPVTQSVEEVVAALDRIAGLGGPEPEYADRIERGFPLRDGRCCERTVAAIRGIGRP